MKFTHKKNFFDNFFLAEKGIFDKGYEKNLSQLVEDNANKIHVALERINRWRNYIKMTGVMVTILMMSMS
jgi:hypothetical protein